MSYTNSTHNIVLMTDTTDVLTMQKTLGVYKVAHELRRAGFEVAVINHLHIFSWEEILHTLRNLINEKTLFVGFNNIFYQDISQAAAADGEPVYYTDASPGSMLPHGVNRNAELRSFIKNLNPNCKLVLGGPTAHDASYNSDYDYIVSGYADVSAVNLANHLVDNDIKLLKSYRSVYGPTIVNDSRAETFDFANSSMQFELHDTILPGEALPFEMARGCIFKCAFCSYPLNGKKKLDFIKDPNKIFQELMSNYQQFGTTKYIFTDDTFNDSVEKCKIIYDISKRLPFKIEYWAYIRLDLLAAHQETIHWLFDSGLRGCFFGIETFNQSTGSLIGKGGKRENLLKTLRYIKNKWGNQAMLHGSFIFGLPHESIESIQQTVDLLLGPDNPLDSWHLKPLSIKANSNNWTSGFLSDIDINYKKYGYEKIGENNLEMVWKNKHTDYLSIKNLVESVHKKGAETGNTVISSRYAFQLAGLGYDLDIVANKSIKDFDWHTVTVKKQQRAREYKNQLYKNLNIPNMRD